MKLLWELGALLVPIVLLVAGSRTASANPERKLKDGESVTRVTVDWHETVAVSRLTPSLQVVVNPLLRRDSPVHDAMFNSLAELKAHFVRYVPWKSYPKLAVTELEPPSGTAECRFITGTKETNEFVHIACGIGQISKVDFASFGNPTGFCGNLSVGKCHAEDTLEFVKKQCIGLESCSFPVNTKTFGDPCPGTIKGFAMQVQCKPPMNHTYYDFDLINQMLEDFMNATSNHSVIINFSTIPEWMYKDKDRVKYPDDPNQIAPYSLGTELVDPTAKQVGDYYGRLVSWYTQGGFVDEYGVERRSPYHYDFQYWECLNEVNGEHKNTPESYTRIYDQMVMGIRRHGDPAHKIKFMGLALGGALHADWYTYWLNKSNHVSDDIPLDAMSFHFYASCENRTDPVNYQEFFARADTLVSQVSNVTSLRDAMSPHTLIDIDETGIILPDDNVVGAPMFPLVYYNAAGAMFAYLYGKLAATGIDVLGESQLVGNPTLPDLDLPSQYPSVAMLNWTNGLGNARYHVLKVLIENFQPGDKLVKTTAVQSSKPGPVGPDTSFCGRVPNLEVMNLKCTDPTATIDKILFASYGTVKGYICGQFEVGKCNAANSTDIVEKACLGKNTCSIDANTPVFGDPCVLTFKYLAVQARCTHGNGEGTGGGGAEPVYAQAFTAPDGSNRRYILVNKTPEHQQLQVAGATGATAYLVDETRPTGPAEELKLTSDTVRLLRYAVMVVVLPKTG